MNHWCEQPQTTSGASPILPEARKRAQARKIVCTASVPMHRKRELFQMIESSRISSLNLDELQRQVRQIQTEQAAKVRQDFRNDVDDVLSQVEAEVLLEERAKFRGGRRESRRMSRRVNRRKNRRSVRKLRKSR